jgi:hypothetical protein
MRDRGRIRIHGRFHNHVQRTIRPNQQHEIGTFRTAVRPGNVENSLGVFEERIHMLNHLLNLSAAPRNV